LLGAFILLGGALVAGAIKLFVEQVRRGEIRWRQAARVGAVVIVVLGLAEVNQLAKNYQQYSTSIPLVTFWITNGVALAIAPLVGGLLAALAVGFATSLYPQAWAVLHGAARRVWRRDAALTVALTLAALAGLSNLSDWIAARFPAYAPVAVELVPRQLDAAFPGPGFFFRGVLYGLLAPTMLGVLIYLARGALQRRAGWVWAAAVLLFLSLGPSRAHSLGEFSVGWAINFLILAVAAVIVAVFARDNVLAYVAAAFCFPLAQPVILMLRQPSAFFRWNGVGLALLALGALGWMFWGKGEPFPRSQGE
jgi:hypothetical protein